jgi:hypothetical protein
MKRREFIARLGAASAWAAVARGQQVQTYPSRIIGKRRRWNKIVGYAMVTIVIAAAANLKSVQESPTY